MDKQNSNNSFLIIGIVSFLLIIVGSVITVVVINNNKNNQKKCKGNFTGDDCTKCKGNFTGDDCTKCINDNFIDDECTDCKGNFTGDNCTDCKGNFTGDNCTDCKGNFTGDNCSDCKGNFKGDNCDSICDDKNLNIYEDGGEKYICPPEYNFGKQANSEKGKKVSDLWNLRRDDNKLCWMAIDQENCGNSPCDPSKYTLPNGKKFTENETNVDLSNWKDFKDGKLPNYYNSASYPNNTYPLYMVTPHKYDEVC